MDTLKVASLVLGLVVAIACSTPTQGIRVFAPLCANQPDLTPSLAGQMALLDHMFEARGLALTVLDMPLASTLLEAVGEPRTGWFFLSFTGHGARRLNGPSEICVAAERDTSLPAGCTMKDGALSVNDCLLSALPSGLSGATFVLDACESAQVDPRRAKVPVSIISSSPYIVDSSSLFGDRLALALQEASNDPNCDGLVTDQELFDALLRNLYGEISSAESRAYPKLRRNAPSHIPLPMQPQANGSCRSTRAEMEGLARESSPMWAPLAAALRAQLKLRPFADDKATLPSVPRDYFVVGGSKKEFAQVRKLADEAGLVEFPGDATLAERVARFAIFTEIYELSVRCAWVRVTRLRDGRLMAVRPIAELVAGLPRRTGISVRHRVAPEENPDTTTLCVARYSRLGPKTPGRPVHCPEAEGQCFLEQCPNLGGSHD